MFVDYQNGSDEDGDGTLGRPYKTIDWALHKSKNHCVEVLSSDAREDFIKAEMARNPLNTLQAFCKKLSQLRLSMN